MSIYKPIILFCCVLLVFGELNKLKTNKRGLLGLFVCLIMFIVTFAASNGANQNTVPALFLYVYAARNIEFKKIAKFSAIVSSVLFSSRLNVLYIVPVVRFTNCPLI